MVIKDTVLQKRFFNKEFDVFTIEKYAEILAKFLQNLRQDVILHRVMADSTIENGLVAPLWSGDKNNSLNFIRNYLKKL
jgi:radical SAM superfamily enzyme